MITTHNSTSGSQSTTTTSTSSIYGPVRSWRVGMSLGVDLLLNTSICSFNCVYCQLGDIQLKTAERKVYVPTTKVADDLAQSPWQHADVVTFSGNGEPTLALNLGECLQLVKASTAKPTMVLTNATLLNDTAVQADLAHADHVACKLDAATDAVLQRMNRPVAGITMASIVQGIQAFKASYTGKLSLQCMFMPTNFDEVDALAELVASLAPHEVQLNTPKRPYPLSWVVESRGNHGEPIVDSRTLRTLSEPQADEIEARLRATLGQVTLLSIYKR